jgi:hypothetical protein
MYACSFARVTSLVFALKVTMSFCMVFLSMGLLLRWDEL